MRRVFVLAVLSCALLIFPQLSLAEGDDDIPGVPIAASPVLGYLDRDTDRADVMSIAMRKSDRLSLTINGQSTLVEGFHWVVVRVYSPDAMGIAGTSPLAHVDAFKFPATRTFSAPSSDTYYLGVEIRRMVDGGAGGYGNYSLAWTCQSPTITALTTRSSSVRRGASASVAGVVRYAADSSGVVRHSVALEKSATGKGGWKRVTSKATDDSGKFSFKVKPGKTTWYRVASPNTASLMKSTSTVVKIRVR